jgi:aryl-alcohol dehydrogenase-like predicted oxidoreductase
MDFAGDRKILLLAYSPLLQGYYANPSRAVPPLYAGEYNLSRMDALKKVAAELGKATLNQIVLAWMRARPTPLVPLISGDSPDQVAESIRALDIHFTEEQLRTLDDA